MKKPSKMQLRADQARMLKTEIGKVRCWIAGFEAGKGPSFNGIPGAMSLVQTQILLQEIIKENSK